MPYPNEHSARIKDPGSFQSNSFRRKNIAPGVDMVMGKPKNSNSMMAQSVRFDKNKFTAVEAKKWMTDHDMKYISFEAASSGAAGSKSEKAGGAPKENGKASSKMNEMIRKAAGKRHA